MYIFGGISKENNIESSFFQYNFSLNFLKISN